MLRLQCDAQNAPRLDSFLLAACPGLDTGRLHKYLRENKIKLNGAKAALSTRLEAGDEVALYLQGEALAAALSGALPPILYEDAQLLAFNKPAGLVSLAAQGADSLQKRAQAYLGTGEALLCHRLDTGTSGVILLAKTKAMAAAMEELMLARGLTKNYICVTVGAPSPPAGLLEGWHHKNPKTGTVHIGQQKRPGAKPVATRYCVQATQGNLALLEVSLITGRTHQIRAQLAAIGSPILGDSKYGNNALNRQLHCKYQCLCAKSVRFPNKLGGLLAPYAGLVISCEDPWFVEGFHAGNWR